LTDDRIDLGSMEFVTGKAFGLGDEAAEDAIPTLKSWEQIDGRTFLIEKLPWQQIQAEFQKLPPHQASMTPQKREGVLTAKNQAAQTRRAGILATAFEASL